MADQAFNWNEYLNLAELALDHIPSAYSYRTTVSPAYYIKREADDTLKNFAN